MKFQILFCMLLFSSFLEGKTVVATKAPPPGTITATQLYGSWAVNCAPNENGFGSHQFQDTYTPPNQVVQLIRTFFTNNCSERPQSTLRRKHIFKLGSLSKQVEGATEIVYSNSTSNAVAESSEVANEYNNIAMCGIKTWASGIVKEIPVGIDCQFSVRKGKTLGVIQIRGNQMHRSGPAQIELDLQLPFTKQ